LQHQTVKLGLIFGNVYAFPNLSASKDENLPEERFLKTIIWILHHEIQNLSNIFFDSELQICCPTTAVFLLPGISDGATPLGNRLCPHGSKMRQEQGPAG
jgi:hypothetical protein